MRSVIVALCVVAPLFCGSSALGQFWFEDDFDSYVSEPCEDPCDCSSDQAAFQAKWQAGPNSNVSKVEGGGDCPSNFWGWDPPYAWVNGKGAFQAVRSLIPEIQAASGDPTKNAVNGTATNPLVFRFHLYRKTNNPGFTSLWAQLFAAPASLMLAPTNTEGLSTCVNSVCVGGPSEGKSCINSDTCNAMKLEHTGSTSACTVLGHTPSVRRPAVAAGCWGGGNGLVPKPPCANITTREFSRAVLFEGDAWWQLLGNDVPPGSTGGDIGALKPGDTLITLAIYDTTINVSLTAVDKTGICTANVCVGGPNNGQPCTDTSTCRPYVTTTKTGIPRQYLGAFQAVAIGTGPIFDGTGDSYESAGTETAGYIDSMNIEGGEFLTLPTGGCCQPSTGSCVDGVLQAACDQQGGIWGGADTTCATATCAAGACCQIPGTCTEVNQADCVAQSGTFRGVGTHCSDPGLLCCPKPWADADGDNDVDMDDYGAFQACFTGITVGPLPGKCACFDKATPTNALDGADFDAFVRCVSGPSVPFVQANHPNCPQ